MNIVNFSKEELQSQQIEVSHLEEILKDFRRDGYVILKDVFSKDFINTLHADFIGNYEHFFSEEYKKKCLG